MLLECFSQQAEAALYLEIYLLCSQVSALPLGLWGCSPAGYRCGLSSPLVSQSLWWHTKLGSSQDIAHWYRSACPQAPGTYIWSWDREGKKNQNTESRVNGNHASCGKKTSSLHVDTPTCLDDLWGRGVKVEFGDEAVRDAKENLGLLFGLLLQLADCVHVSDGIHCRSKNNSNTHPLKIKHRTICSLMHSQ